MFNVTTDVLHWLYSASAAVSQKRSDESFQVGKPFVAPFLPTLLTAPGSLTLTAVFSGRAFAFSQSRSSLLLTNSRTFTIAISPTFCQSSLQNPYAMFTLCRIAVSCGYIMKNNGTELEQVVHTHRTSSQLSIFLPA